MWLECVSHKGHLIRAASIKMMVIFLFKVKGNIMATLVERGLPYLLKVGLGFNVGPRGLSPTHFGERVGLNIGGGRHQSPTFSFEFVPIPRP